MERRIALAAGLLPFLWAGALMTWRPEARGVQWDVDSFVNFAPFRTAGYPGFLKAVEAMTGSLAAVPALQVVLFAAAASGLLLATWFATRSRLATALAALLFLGNPVTAMFHLKTMSDSLALTLAVAFMACAFAAHRTPTAWILVAMGLCAGWATAIRPASIALALAGLAFLWMSWPRDRSAAALRALAFLVPFAGCLLAENVVYHRYHPVRETVATRHLLAKSMLLPQPPAMDGELGDIASGLHAAYAPVRDLIASLPTYGTRWYMNTRYEVTGQWVLYDTPSVVARTGELGHDVAMGAIAKASLHQFPLQHLRHAIENWFALWYVTDMLNPEEGRVIAALAARDPPVPFAGKVDVLPNRPATAWSHVVQPLFLAGMLAPLLVLGFAFRRGEATREDPFLTLAAMMSIYVLAQSAIVAFTAVAISRYALAIFPFAWLCGGLLALSLLRPETLLGALRRRGGRGRTSIA